MPTARAWDKNQIMAEIVRRGVSPSALSRGYGLSASAVRLTLYNRAKAITAADQAISDFIGVPLHELWPERYDDRGNRLVPLKSPPRRLPSLPRPEPAPNAQAA